MDLTIVLERGEDGMYVAHCPALKSCWSQKLCNHRSYDPADNGAGWKPVSGTGSAGRRTARERDRSGRVSRQDSDDSYWSLSASSSEAVPIGDVPTTSPGYRCAARVSRDTESAEAVSIATLAERWLNRPCCGLPGPAPYLRRRRVARPG